RRQDVSVPEPSGHRVLRLRASARPPDDGGPGEFPGRSTGRRIVLDEIHRLPNPSEMLKIAADHYPRTRVIATGSSTLGASTKFRDTLAGRKRDLWLTRPPCVFPTSR